MNIAINIRKNHILQEVNKLTAFTARQIEGGFDKIAATTDEEKMVLSFLEQGITELSGHLTRYSPIVSDDTIDVYLPPTFDVLLLDSLERTISLYLICDVCARWFAITKPDEQSFLGRKSDLLVEIISLLNVRIKPTER